MMTPAAVTHTNPTNVSVSNSQSSSSSPGSTSNATIDCGSVMNTGNHNGNIAPVPSTPSAVWAQWHNTATPQLAAGGTPGTSNTPCTSFQQQQQQQQMMMIPPQNSAGSNDVGYQNGTMAGNTPFTPFQHEQQQMIPPQNSAGGYNQNGYWWMNPYYMLAYNNAMLASTPGHGNVPNQGTGMPGTNNKTTPPAVAVPSNNIAIAPRPSPIHPAVLVASNSTAACTGAPLAVPGNGLHNGSVTLPVTQESVEDVDDGKRRSGRKRCSTVIQVGEFTVKRDNNYVLKGDSYEYGAFQHDAAAANIEQPKKPRKVAVKKQKVQDGGEQPLRIIAPAEQARLQQKANVEQRIEAKKSNRQQFLKANVEALKPFLEQRVVEAISAVPDSNGGDSAASSTLYMQPDAITGDLRDYQLESLNWMSTMHSKNIGFILGDEMGLVRAPMCSRYFFVFPSRLN